MEYVLSGCEHTPSRVAPQVICRFPVPAIISLIAGAFCFVKLTDKNKRYGQGGFSMINQVSVFTENTKGAMLKVSKLISDAGIDIYNVVTNDSAEFGIVRMLVTEPEKADELLRQEGYMSKLDSVIGVEIPDEVGSLTKLLEAIDESNINIDYIYVSFSRDFVSPLAVLKVNGYLEVESCLRSKGYKTV